MAMVGVRFRVRVIRVTVRVRVRVVIIDAVHVQQSWCGFSSSFG